MIDNINMTELLNTFKTNVIGQDSIDIKKNVHIKQK